MLDLAEQLQEWWQTGSVFATATVVRTWESAPRPVGTSMAVGPDGSVIGSVTAGCVESELVILCEEVMVSGQARLVTFGVTDEDALQAGLMCGGTIEVFVRPVSRSTMPQLNVLVGHLRQGSPVVAATVIEHPDENVVGRQIILSSAADTAGTLGSHRLDAAVADDALGQLAQGAPGVLTYGPEGERRGEGVRVFVHTSATRPRLLVFGATDFAAALARIGSFLGYEVTVCDARPTFTTPARFPHADHVVRAQPHAYLSAEAAAGRIDSRTAICVLSHDPRFDIPVLRVALELPEVGYVGAMASRRTHDDRLSRLRQSGLSSSTLARLRSPIGLDLGGRTPEETALSIAAEIVATRWGGTGSGLSGTTGRVHRYSDGSNSELSPFARWTDTEDALCELTHDGQDEL